MYTDIALNQSYIRLTLVSMLCLWWLLLKLEVHQRVLRTEDKTLESVSGHSLSHFYTVYPFKMCFFCLFDVKTGCAALP